MSMIALSLSLKLLIFKSLVLNMVLILKLLLITEEPLLLVLMFLKKIGTCIMNLSKTLAWKMRLLLMIADRKSTRLNSSHITRSRMPSSA